MNPNEIKYPLESLKDQVVEIVRTVAEEIKTAAFTITEKNKAINIVTSSDLLSQRLLVEKLGALLPESGFYCEEEGLQETEKDYIWVIDPIDGTANYARHIADCAISVALTYKKEAILGVVCGIYTGDVYSATLGGGSTLNGKKITVTDNNFESAILCTAMSVYKKEYAKVCNDIIYETYMLCNDYRRFGTCALELCYIASGKCDIYFELRVFPWDYAAGLIILKEAGGIVRGLADSELDFSRPSVVVGANNKENYEKLSRIVNKHLPTTPYED